jgi:predicted RNA binding protein with dsRBD fold (UPF0201 family)
MSAQILDTAIQLKTADRSRDIVLDLEKQAAYYCQGAVDFIKAAMREAHLVGSQAEEGDDSASE